MGRMKIKAQKKVADDIDPTDTDFIAVIILPKEPYLNWVRSIPDPDLVVTLEELRDEPQVYLLPSLGLPDNDSAWAWVEENFEDLFLEHLSGWWTEEADFPQERTYEMFRDWFEVHVSSLVNDETVHFVNSMKEQGFR